MQVLDPNHSIWNNAFSEATRQQQLNDDAVAWRNVTGILLTIVSLGVCLAVFSVWICSL